MNRDNPFKVEMSQFLLYFSPASFALGFSVVGQQQHSAAD